MPEPNPLRGQDLVPALDEPGVVLRDFGQVVSTSSVLKNTS